MPQALAGALWALLAISLPAQEPAMAPGETLP